VPDLFDKPDTAKLKNEKVLNQIGERLERTPYDLIVVAAYSGLRGETEENLVLTQARAMVVRQHLAEHFKINDQRIKTIGMGEDSATTDKRAARVAIIVYPPQPAQTERLTQTKSPVISSAAGQSAEFPGRRRCARNQIGSLPITARLSIRSPAPIRPKNAIEPKTAIFGVRFEKPEENHGGQFLIESVEARFLASMADACGKALDRLIISETRCPRDQETGISSQDKVFQKPPATCLCSPGENRFSLNGRRFRRGP
jgi:hypothetical protein